MIKRAIALRYAKALFELDFNKDKVEKKIHEFELIQALLQEQSKLFKFLKTPQISMVEKKEVLKTCLEDKLDPIFLNFFLHLMDEGRLENLAQIAIEYRLMAHEFLGIWEAKIITAVPLKEEIESKLKTRLEDFYHKKIKIKKEVNPTILGGAILVVDNQMIDWSVTDRLKKMKEELLTTI